MKILISIVYISIFSMVGLSAQSPTKNDITVVITNFNSNDGKAFVALYNSEDSFLRKGIRNEVRDIENKSCTLVFKNLPNGIYAISMFHDENDNGKMDTNFMKIPKEDYGCSNNAKGVMGPPKWRDAKFEVKNTSVTQNIKI